MDRQTVYQMEQTLPDEQWKCLGQFPVYLRNEGVSEKEIQALAENMDFHMEFEREDFWAVFSYKYAAVFVEKIESGGPDGCEKQIARLFPLIRTEDKETEDACYVLRELLYLYFGTWDPADYTKEQVKIRNQAAEEIRLGAFKYKAHNCIGSTARYESAVRKYIAQGLSRKEKAALGRLPVIHSAGGKKIVYPLTADGKFVIGMVNPWPGDKSAEAEVLSRMKAGAEDIGLGYLMLDNFGHILDEKTQKASKTYVKPQKLDFVITTHYDSEKTVDSFYYHTLWNPPEIPLNLPDYYTRVTNNYLMNDDYLIYDSGGMSNHLRGILSNRPRTLEGASALTASFPKSRMLKPRLENPRLFYCGMNWERVTENSSRHEGLFQLLDGTGKVKFFGPDKVQAWGGIRPWEGYKCYQYPIPFDGFSILEEINACGICLVLSSDIHRRAGAATNRTYEACAAGAVMIADDNEFMQRYFKDAALFIEYNKKDPQDTFEQIMEKYEWITAHKEQALQMAAKAQAVFLEHFSVDAQMLRIVNRHAFRFRTIADDLFAEDEQGTVLVTYVINSLDVREAEKNCRKVISNIKNQYYENIRLGIACDERIKKEVAALVKRTLSDAVIISFDLYDRKGSKQYTDGQAIRIVQKNVAHEYWINIYAHEIWFYDHITTLVRCIADEDAAFAYAGRQHRDKLGYARSDFFDVIHLATVFYMDYPDWLPVPGQILFRRLCSDFVLDYMMECLDGYEHYAYIGAAWIKHKQKAAFSKRMTSCWSADDMDERCIVLKAEYQIRYIRDLLRFSIPDGGLSAGIMPHKEEMQRYILNYPVRTWMRVKWYNLLLRRLKRSDHGMYRRIKRKYDQAFQKFHAW